MKRTPAKEFEPTTRTSAGLRDALFDELDALRNGVTNPSKANATAKLADGIINTVRMEMEVDKHLASASSQATVLDRSLGAPLSLGAK